MGRVMLNNPVQSINDRHIQRWGYHKVTIENEAKIMAGNYEKWEKQYQGRVWFYGFTRSEVEDLVCPVVPEENIKSIKDDESQHKYFIYSNAKEFNNIQTSLMLDKIQIHPVRESSPSLYYVVKDRNSIKRYA